MSFNPYNYGTTSDKISDQSHIVGLDFYSRDDGSGDNTHRSLLPVQNLSQNITVKIPRPAAEVPEWHGFIATAHNVTGMSYHSFHVRHNYTSVTVEVKAGVPGVRYVVYLKYEIPPTIDDFDEVFVMPKSLSESQCKYASNPLPHYATHAVLYDLFSVTHSA